VAFYSTDKQGRLHHINDGTNAPGNKKTQLSLTNPRARRESMPKLLQFDVKTSCRQV